MMLSIMLKVATKVTPAEPSAINGSAPKCRVIEKAMMAARIAKTTESRIAMTFVAAVGPPGGGAGDGAGADGGGDDGVGWGGVLTRHLPAAWHG